MFLRSRHEKIVEVELELAAGTPLRSGMTVDVYFASTGPSAICEPDDG